MMHKSWIRVRLFISACFVLSASIPVQAQRTTVIRSGERTMKALKDTNVRMEGKSELHLTARENPTQNCKFNLASEDAWLFFDNIRPSIVAEMLPRQVWVKGSAAELDRNIRVVQFGEGTVVIPHSADFRPLEVFARKGCTGPSIKLAQYTGYQPDTMGEVGSMVRSFILKRGYMATFAAQPDGTGQSKVYVAQDEDLRVTKLPSGLEGQVQSVRVFPWRWTSKKGAANLKTGLNLNWWYNWNINERSTLDMEYVAIKQNRYWPGLDQDWKALGVNHLLGYNEPDKSDQANLSVDEAIAGWPELLATGLRLGSPAVTDSAGSGQGLNWLMEFLDKAEERNYRVDFVVVHYYRSHWDPGDPDGAARQLYDYLKYVHEETDLPIWITEWNNGANWTNDSHDPTAEQQAEAIQAMVEMLDDADFVERYAIYNWVEDVRRVQWDDGSLTEAGKVYRDEPSPVGYEQK